MKLTLPFLPVLLLTPLAALCAAEPSLVPDAPNTAPDYFCTWNVQGFACSYSGASNQADMMTEASLFGKGPNQNWVEFFPDVRGDLIFLLDDAFDFPLGGGHNCPVRGSVELDGGRFPSFQGTPAERLAKLNRDVKARGWRRVGLWICNSRNRLPGQEQVDSDTYWNERLAWSQQAGIGYWKVDWGMGERSKPLWKFRVTPQGRSVAPDVWIEFGTQGDVYRTYDVAQSVSIPETIRRIGVFLAKDDPQDQRLINCEDEVYIGAGLGCHYGVMRHPLTGDMPNGKPDGFFPAHFRDVKRRLDEVTRAVRWHRIAQPISRGDKVAIDPNHLTDFKSKPAPARIARGGLPLPTVVPPAGQEPPYVLCARHPDGQIAVATVPRNLGANGRARLTFPLADVTLEVGELNRPVGIFGEYASLTFVTTSALAGKRILAQDLAGSTPVDITSEVKTSEGRLTIPGPVIHRVGLMAAQPGDISDPGLVLAIRGLTEFVSQPAMTPGKSNQPERQAATKPRTGSEVQNSELAGGRPTTVQTITPPILNSVPRSPAATTSVAPAAETVSSPDGKIQVTVGLERNVPYWQITCGGATVIEPSVLGVELSADNFAGPFVLTGTERTDGDTTWQPVWGNLSQVRDHFDQLTVKVQEAAGQRRTFHVVIRAYDEGVACRYAFPRQPGLDHLKIKKRLTEYRFGSNRPIYQNRKYEYGTAGIDTMSKSEGNVTVDVGGGRFVSLTDADRADFSQVSWERKKDRSGTIIGTLHSPAEGTPPFYTSWEVMLVGDTAAKLYENRHVVENLNPPCAIADTSWIRPGEAICQVRNTRMVTSELKKLLDFASAHNVEYLEIDHSWCGAETQWTPAEIEFFEKNKSKFWDDKPEWRKNIGGNLLAPAKGWVPFRPKADSGGNYVDLDVPELTAHGRRLNPPVGVCLYVRGAVLKEFGGEHAIEEVFATYERWGVAGVKPGFVPPASQQNERTIAYMLKKAAEHKLIAVIHDAYYPSGLSRTYPNLMNVEGVAGDEAEHSIDPQIKSRHDVMLPFTRCLMGPVDYTPEMFKSSKTHAHQVAMLGVYHGRPSIRGGMRPWSPGGVGGGEIEFVEKLPGLFDEMKVVADLGQSVTLARRRGERWFVASMSDGNPRSYALPLDFLHPGVTYNASIYADVPGKPQTAHVVQTVSSTSVIQIGMQPNGGHLMILEPARPSSGP